MNLRIYNTLSGRKERFEPLESGQVRMYVCGVTVYDECHVGHARSVIVFDTIFRYLVYRGYRVTYVRNFTDVDDKIIKRAAQEGIPWYELSRTYIASFHRDMDALGTLRPTLEPQATEHIRDMIDAIAALEQRGSAYCVNGNVYFSVAGFPEYGKLSRRNRDQMIAGARLDVDEMKQNPLDFALWKRSQPSEPAWESPWGLGRPGWHIECSCMSQKYLGETFDIHGGGVDLVFPHHENEIAQAEGLTGKPFARYWIHNGPLTRDGTKMSKSLGNILSIQDALAKYHPEELRLFMLMGHHRKPLDFTTDGMRTAQMALDRFYTTRSRMLHILPEQPDVREVDPVDTRLDEDGRSLWESIQSFRQRFENAMDDDFNTAQSLAHLFDLTRLLNQWMDQSSFNPTPDILGVLRGALACFTLFDEVMGLFTMPPGDFFRQKEDLALKELGMTREQIQFLLRRRSKAREEKNWKEADQIRDDLQKRGIQVLDQPGETTWRVRPGASV